MRSGSYANNDTRSFLVTAITMKSHLQVFKIHQSSFKVHVDRVAVAMSITTVVVGIAENKPNHYYGKNSEAES